MNNNPFNPLNRVFLRYEECDCSNSDSIVHSVSIVDSKGSKMPWVTTLKCTKNNGQPSWFICKLCDTQRIQFKNMTQLKTHHYNCHSLPTKNVHLDQTLCKGNKKLNTNTVDGFKDYSMFNNEMDYFDVFKL